MEYPFTANVPEVSAKHHGLALIADNVKVGDAILPHIGKQLRICAVGAILLAQWCVIYVYLLFQVRKRVTYGSSILVHGVVFMKSLRIAFIMQSR